MVHRFTIHAWHTVLGALVVFHIVVDPIMWVPTVIVVILRHRWLRPVRHRWLVVVVAGAHVQTLWRVCTYLRGFRCGLLGRLLNLLLTADRFWLRLLAIKLGLGRRGVRELHGHHQRHGHGYRLAIVKVVPARARLKLQQACILLLLLL